MTGVAGAVYGRCFPRVTESFLDSGDRRTRRTLSQVLTDALWPSRTNCAGMFGRIQHAHEQAFEAELAGKWDRANFYWKELSRQILEVREDDPSWGYSKSLSPKSSNMTGPEFRSCFVREVVLDSHAGFFHGQVEAGLSPLARPRFHLESLSNLIHQFPEITLEQERSLADPLALRAVEAQKSDAEKGSLEEFWFTMATCFPRQPQYTEAALSELYSRTVKDLKSDADTNKTAILANAISKAEVIRGNSPGILACYQLLATLYYEQTIAMANAMEIPAAFLALKKAQIYGGERTPGLTETEKQLHEILCAMRESAKAVAEKVRTTPGTVLNEKGRNMAEAAATGTSLAANWERSPAAEQIRAERATAMAPAVAPVSATYSQDPLIQVKTVAKQRGAEALSDWLASNQGRHLRWQILTSALLALITLCLFSYQEWGRFARDRAWHRAQAALQANDDTAAIDAMGDFFSAPKPLRANRDMDVEAATIYSRAIAHWIATKQSGLTDNEKLRLAKYKKQVVDTKLDSNPEVQQ